VAVNDFNASIIEEFRANGGKVGGPFEGASMLLLHTTGARSGEERVAPLVYRTDGGRIVVFASKAGAPTHPDWYRNLVADPSVILEVGNETFPATALVLDGDERDRVFAEQAAEVPTFGDYARKAGGRIIPVVALIRN